MSFRVVLPGLRRAFGVALFLGFLLMDGATAQERNADTPSRGATEQQMENAVRSYFERVNRGDIDGIVELFAGDGEIVNTAAGTDVVRGRDSLKKFYRDLLSTFSVYRVTPGDILIDGNRAVARLYFEAKRRDQTAVIMDNLNFWVFEKTKFKILRVYYSDRQSPK